MNKKVIAVAIATAFAASGAYADATLYGKFHGSVDMIDSDSDFEDNWQVNSRSSRVGIKGSEDLGGGLKAIYQLELGVNLDGGGQGQDNPSSGLGGASRNTFLGLAGDWGTVFIGRHDTPAKVAFYGSKVENLGDSALDINSGNNLNRKATNPNGAAPLGVISEYRASDVIAYVSPNFSGFTFLAAMMPGEDNDFVSDERDSIADHWSVGGMYQGGGLAASAGYAMYNSGDAGDGDVNQKVAQGSVSYTFGAFKVGGTYEYTDNYVFDNDGDYTAWAVTGQYKFGNNAVSLVYSDGNYNTESGLGQEQDGWGIGFDHSFSKRTMVYAAYASATVEPDIGGDDDNDIFSVGMIHKF